MALKDWKEITFIKGSYYDRIWKSKKTGNLLILTQAYHNQVEVESSRDIRIYDSGWLKTKSQALAFAKAYMRKH